jgi:hypothetical protein
MLSSMLRLKMSLVARDSRISSRVSLPFLISSLMATMRASVSCFFFASFSSSVISSSKFFLSQ